MDISFESDQKSSTREESDFDAQLIAEQDNSRLKEENEKLNNELNVIRAQFGQAMNVTQKMDKVHQKNQKLTKCIRILQLENDELKKKLEITQHANEEILDKLNQEKFNFSAQLSRENSLKEKEISTSKKNAQIELEKLNNQITELSKICDQKELQNKLTTNKVDRLLHTAGQYFYQEFPNIDAFISFLSNAPVITSKENQNQKDDTNRETNEELLSKLQKKLKSSKNQIKNLKQDKQDLESEISHLKTENLKKENKLVEINTSIERDINQIQEDHSIKVNDLETQNQQLVSKVKSLKDEIQQMKIVLKAMKSKELHVEQTKPIQTETVIQKVQQIDKTGYIEEIELLKSKNSEQGQKLNESETKIEKLQSKIKKYETIVNSLELDLSNITNKYGALEIAHKETLTEIESLRKSFNIKISRQKESNDKKQLFVNMKSQMNHLEDKIKHLTNDLHEVSVEKEQLKRKTEVQQTKMNQLKDELDECQSRNEFLKEELHSAKEQLFDKPKVTIETFIPAYSWRFNDFDRDLSNELEKVIINPLLQPASKLNSIYKTINNYFNELIKKKENDQSQILNQINSLKSIFSHFVVDLCIALQVPSMELNDFIERSGSDTILTKIKTLSQSLDDEKRQNNAFSQVIDHIASEFSDIAKIPSNFNISELPSYFSSAKEKFECFTKTNKLKNKKIKELKNGLSILDKNSTNEITLLKTDLETVSASYEALQVQNDQMTKDYNEIRKQLRMSKNEFQEFKSITEEKEKQIHEEYENTLNSTKQEYDTKISNLKSQISHLNKEKQSLDQTYSSSQSSIDRLKSIIEQDRKAIEEKNSIIRQLKVQNETELNKLTEKCKIEKEQLIQNYEKAVSEISKQCDMHRNDLEKVSSELSDINKLNKQSQSYILKLKREKLKLERELNSLKEQNKREKQISEANTKSQILHAEEISNQKIQDVQNKCESDKRRIFTFAADEFRTYFDPSEKMDERTFRSFLMKIKKELEKLKEADTIIRRLVGAGPQQTTDDAVAQYLAM